MDIPEKDIRILESELDSFDPVLRRKSLLSLLDHVNSHRISCEPQREIANLHSHSFFSFNGYDYSPTHLAWLGKKHGIKFMGVVDFDVLDAVDEFLDACEIAGVCGTAGMETRVFLPEFSDFEINSPGEPGICYHMGTGFTSSVVPEAAQTILQTLRSGAAERNQEILKRVNAFVSPLYIDYEEDVLPLTPAGVATERHMVHVLAKKAADTLDDPVDFWGEKLGMEMDALAHFIKDNNKFEDLLRSKLMKSGGIGYVQPTAGSFPTVEEFHQLMTASGALPCSAWLDGTSAGEQRIEELLELLTGKGVTVINIVPDRNWNIKDVAEKQTKLKNLYHVVEVAQNLALPILVGTEMNKFGQKLIDDFDAPELEPVRSSFIDGAYMMYGHTQMQRYWGIGYASAWADTHFADRAAKNEFYRIIGRLIEPGIKHQSDAFACYEPGEVIAHFT